MREATWSLVSPKTVERSEKPVGCSLDSPLSSNRVGDFGLWTVCFLKVGELLVVVVEIGSDFEALCPNTLRLSIHLSSIALS